jgi:hypothetical protein
VRYQPEERAIRISELYFTDSWGAVVEELEAVYRINLIQELLDCEDEQEREKLRAKINHVPEILEHLRTQAKKAGEAPKKRATPKQGY